MIDKKILRGSKDFNGFYVDANIELVERVQFKKPQDIIGRHERNVTAEIYSDSLGGTQKLADEYLAEDEIVFRGKMLNALYVAKCRGKVIFLISKKTPRLSNRGKIIGATFAARELMDPTPLFLKNLSFSTRLGLKISEQSQLHIDFYIKNYCARFNLTAREVECIKLLGNGMSTKEIGKDLGLSSRTVECYLENSKNKLLCQTKIDLIKKAIQIGIIDLSLDSV